jgi:hypothetical protein
MSSRKETPDVLGEILNSPTEPTASVPVSVTPKTEGKPTPQATQTKSRSKSKRRAAGRQMSPEWEYLEVTFREYRGWRPRFVNGEELDEWKEQPEIVDYLNELGQGGWEMIGIVNGRRNTRDVYFKRVCGSATK